jgi:uncharacterized protein YjbI with pentapeptide repeats
MVFLSIAISAVLIVPGWWVDRDATGDLEPVERVQALQDARQSVLWTIGGFIAVVGLLFTKRRDDIARANHDLDRDANLTDRYTEAVAQLGSDAMAVRLGGLYALERIARDSERDRETIVDVLTAWLRARTDGGQPEPITSPETERAPTDVRAAVVVVGKLSVLLPKPVLDLSSARLSGSQLHSVRANTVNLDDAVLTRTYIWRSAFKWVHMFQADLRHAQISDTTIEYLVLTKANATAATIDLDTTQPVLAHELNARNSMWMSKTPVVFWARGSVFASAHMDAILREDGSISRMDLSGSELDAADFSEAVLDGIGLRRSTLTEADFTSARLVPLVDEDGAVVRDAGGAPLCPADLRDVDAEGARFSGASAPLANFVDARLRSANFDDCDLTGADLKRADLRSASFRNAILVGANLSDADLEGADLTGARVDGADFSGAADVVLTGTKGSPAHTT